MSLSNNNDGDVNDNDNDDTATTVWSPDLRRIMGGIAGLGALETGYLTYAKLFGTTGVAPTLFCSGSSSGSAALGHYSSCDQVLNGPYSNLPFFENVPLASLGFVAYLSVAFLALEPIIRRGDDTDKNNDGVVAVVVDDDNSNRVLLTALTTSMGTFSIFLMTLLFGILQTSCPYCIFSAACSFLLANIALIGGCLPEQQQQQQNSTTAATTEEAAITTTTTGSRTVAAGFAGAIVGAVLLFGTASIDIFNDNAIASISSSSLATTISGGDSNSQQKQQKLLYAPPEITTESSERALKLGKTLQGMDAKMYGAHWCSHCYDQKQVLGKQVFYDKKFVEYVECSKDGIQNQSKLCKSKEIPGYPTWEIQGKLYPGELELDELEDLVKDLLLVK